MEMSTDNKLDTFDRAIGFEHETHVYLINAHNECLKKNKYENCTGLSHLIELSGMEINHLRTMRNLELKNQTKDKQ